MSNKDPNDVECILKPGDYFDDANLLYDVPRPRTIKAATQVDAITISMGDLNEVMSRFPEDADRIRAIGHNLFGGKINTPSYVSHKAAESESAAGLPIGC